MKMKIPVWIVAGFFSCFAITVLEAMDGQQAAYSFEQVLEMKPRDITKAIAQKIKDRLDNKQPL